MSINDAHALLWQRDTLPTTAFSAFKKHILQELSARNSLIVAQTGAKKKPLKSDYIQALCELRAAIEIERYVAPSIMVRIYQAPRDWQHVLEEKVNLEWNGDLSLSKVTRPEGHFGECRVIDPRNYAPFFAYQPGQISTGDLADLLDEGYLRVAYLKPRKSYLVDL